MKISSVVKKCTAGQKLSMYLSNRFTYHSLDEWENTIKEGRILLNGAVTNCEVEITKGDTIEYIPLKWEEPEADFSYDIIYEDEFLLAINKTGNLIVHASGKTIRNNLIYHLRYVNPQTKNIGKELRLVNRIDRETSGIVLVAKTKSVLAFLSKQFKNRDVKKEYIGIVNGHFANSEFCIDIPIRKKKPLNYEKFECAILGGKESVTNFKVIGISKKYTKLSIRPLTGRTNQIRVHLEGIGHSIVGDKLYSGQDGVFKMWCESGMNSKLLKVLKMKRQALHAEKLKIIHPATNKAMVFKAPLPRDMKEFWDFAMKE